MDASRLVLDKKDFHSEIPAKAYLSRKDIKELVVPNSIDMIGDWAFAFMKNLEIVWVPHNQIRLGREVLKDCDHLHDIHIYIDDMETENSDSTPESRIFANAVRSLGEKEFFLPEKMGSEEWYHNLDESFVYWLEEDNLKGFKPQWFGGEEDYLEDATNSQEMYRKEQEYKKIRLVFQRLDCDKYMDLQYRGKYVDYIKRISTKEENLEQNSAWTFLLENVLYPVYFRIFLELGFVTEEQITWVIEQLDGNYPELISMLLQYATKGENNAHGSFEEFEL